MPHSLSLSEIRLFRCRFSDLAVCDISPIAYDFDPFGQARDKFRKKFFCFRNTALY
jgi:hypothetical protein